MELIKITKTENGQQAVSARELHESLSLTTRFSKWVEQNFKMFVEGEDFCCVTTVTHQNQYGGEKEVDDFALTLDMAKHLAMLSKTEKGKEVRKYFIEVERKALQPPSVEDLIIMQAESVKELRGKVETVETKVQEIENGLQLQPGECDMVSNSVKRRGVYLMGGKSSKAYQSPSIRNKVYRYIYTQLKIEFGVSSYKNIKRKHLEVALDRVAAMPLAFHIQEEVNEANQQLGLAV